MRINKFSQSGSQNTSLSQGLSATLTGPLVLAGNPTGPLEATPKQYVDGAINSLNAANIKTGTINVARLPAFTGDVSSATGSGNFVLNNSGVTAGNYTKVTVDSKGRVVAGGSLTNDDIPPFNWSKINSDKPTTVDGYGITDAIKTGGATITGRLTLNLDPTDPMHAANKQYVDSLNSNGANVTTGTVVRRPVATTPTGFLRANGGSLSRTTYSALFAVVKEPYLVKTTLDYTSYGAMGAGQPWRHQYDFNSTAATLSGWTAGTNLPETRYAGCVVVTKSKVYYLGGYNPSASSSAVIYEATIDSDGTVGAWSVSTSTLPNAMVYAKAVVIKNRLYLIGGQWNGVSGNPTYYTTIDSNGNLGAWSTGSSLVTGLMQHQIVVTKNRIFTLGSVNSSAVYTAPIDANGVIGVWTTHNHSLPTQLSASSLVVVKNRVYLLGGWTSNAHVNKIYYCDIQSDGSLGAWSTSSTNLPSNLAHAQAFATKNRVYVLGGEINVNSPGGSNWSCPINADATLGTWTTDNGFNGARSYSDCFITGSKVVLVGGLGSSGPMATTSTHTFAQGLNDYSKYYDGTINKFDGSDLSGAFVVNDSYDANNGGNVTGGGQPWKQQYSFNTQNTGFGSWTSGGAIPNSVWMSNAIVTKNRVYMIGGLVNGSWSTVIYTAPINADGTLGAWATHSTSLPSAISYGRAVAHKNFAYLVGGSSNKVYRAPINTDGILGTWTQETNTLPTTVNNAAVLITMNRVYVMGADGNANVYTCVINADGTLGSWTVENQLPAAIATSSRLILTNNRVYLVDCNNGKIYLSFLSDTGRLDAWSLYTTAPFTSMNHPEIVVTKNRVFILGAATSPTELSTKSTYTCVINADGTLGSWSFGGSLPGVQFQAQAVVTSSRLYLIGGYDNNGSYPNIQYSCPFSGGGNDYGSYTSGAVTTLDPTKFLLPDLSSLESTNEFYFIKT